MIGKKKSDLSRPFLCFNCLDLIFPIITAGIGIRIRFKQRPDNITGIIRRIFNAQSSLIVITPPAAQTVILSGYNRIIVRINDLQIDENIFGRRRICPDNHGIGFMAI